MCIMYIKLQKTLRYTYSYTHISTNVYITWNSQIFQGKIPEVEDGQGQILKGVPSELFISQSTFLYLSTQDPITHRNMSTFSMSPVIQRLSSRTQFTLVMSLYSNISPCRQTNLPQRCTYRTFALGKTSEGIESMRYCFFHQVGV